MYTYKRIWLINLPVMVSLLVEQLINLTDSIFLGRVSHIDLGASALATLYYTAIYMLGFGFSLGAQVVIARHNGEGRIDRAGRVFWQGVWFLSAFAVVVFALSKLFSPQLLRMVIRSQEVYRATMCYVAWRDYGYLFAFPLLAIRAWFVGTTRTRILTANAIVMVVCNMALDYLLIFGKLGLPRMGIGGAALGSSIAGAVGLAFMVVYMRGRRYGMRPIFDGRLSLQLLGISVWTMVRQFFCIVPWLLFFVAIEHLGQRELAAANVVRTISMLFFVIVNSFSATIISLVGNLLGAGKFAEVRATGWRVIALGYAIGLPFLLLAFLFSGALLRLFTNDAAVVAVAFAPMCVMLSTFMISMPAYTAINAVIGTGRTRAAFVIQIITIAIYLGYLFLLSRSEGIPLALYWTAEQLYVVVLLGLSWRKIAYICRSWKSDHWPG